MTKEICSFSEANFLNFGFMILQLPHHVAEYCTNTTSLFFTMSERLSFSNSCNIIISFYKGSPVGGGYRYPLCCLTQRNLAGQVAGYTIASGVHGVFAFFPVGRANFAEFLHVCIGVDQPEVFLYIAAYWHIVYTFVKYFAIFVNQVSRPERYI